MTQNRWRSKFTWIAIAAIVGSVVNRYIPLVAEDYTFIVDAVLAILTIVGVLNNPTDKENF